MRTWTLRCLVSVSLAQFFRPGSETSPTQQSIPLKLLHMGLSSPWPLLLFLDHWYQLTSPTTNIFLLPPPLMYNGLISDKIREYKRCKGRWSTVVGSLGFGVGSLYVETWPYNLLMVWPQMRSLTSLEPPLCNSLWHVGDSSPFAHRVALKMERDDTCKGLGTGHSTWEVKCSYFLF